MKWLARFVWCTLAVLFTSSAAWAQDQEPGYRQSFSQAELDQMLAPIALYPDSLLSQILMAATYPQDVYEAASWSRVNPGLRGDTAVRAVEGEPWDPSVTSLVARSTRTRCRGAVEMPWPRSVRASARRSSTVPRSSRTRL